MTLLTSFLVRHFKPPYDDLQENIFFREYVQEFKMELRVLTPVDECDVIIRSRDNLRLSRVE